jgi:hypothetical protein
MNFPMEGLKRKVLAGSVFLVRSGTWAVGYVRI